MTKNKKYSVVSLFSGCGGLDLGLHGGFEYLGKRYARHPLQVIYANDINRQATETFRFNFPHVPVHNEDITKVLQGKGGLPKNADVVVGGFPCQDFSLAGKRKGLSVKRGQLYLSMVESVRRIKPKLFLAENVKGLLLWEKGLAMEVITKDFADLGYRVEHRLLNTADFGVPELRERVIIVGVREDLKRNYSWPKPTHAKNGENGLKPWVTLKEALGDLEEDSVHFSLPNSGYSKAKLFAGTQGNKTTSPDRPGPTMRAEHHGNIEFHYLGHRRLSAREAARIQSFPDSFVFYNSTTDAYRQVGNAVAPLFGWHLAKSISKLLKD